jgi:hypothetical protein
MLHELSHNTHQNHSAEFYELWDKLRAEFEENQKKGIKGTGAGFDAKGYRANSAVHNPVSVLEGRERALKAAEKRRKQSELFGEAKSIGGNRPIGLSEKEAVRWATMKRCSEWCGNSQENAEEKKDEEEKIAKRPKVETIDLTKEEEEEEEEEEEVKEVKEEEAGAGEGWNCELCSFRNGSDSVLCEICAVGTKPGYWQCPKCSYVNSSLFRCKTCEAQRMLPHPHK